MTLEDLLMGRSLDSVPADIQANMNDLLWRLNKFLFAFTGPIIPTRCYSTQEEQDEIYRKINEKRMASGDNPIPTPTNSRHLYALAVDFMDAGDLMKNYALQRKDQAHDLGLYFEITNDQHLHIQGVPPKSGKQWFYP